VAHGKNKIRVGPSPQESQGILKIHGGILGHIDVLRVFNDKVFITRSGKRKGPARAAAVVCPGSFQTVRHSFEKYHHCLVRRKTFFLFSRHDGLSGL
jgi:hypothetical protein